MLESLPFNGPDPRQLPAGPGEIFRRQTRAATLLDLAENVDAERRAEIAREIVTLGEIALPALNRAAASRRENSAALSRSLVRMLVPDEIGRQIFIGLSKEKQNYRVENGAILLARLSNPTLPVQRVVRELDELGRKASEAVCAGMGIPRKELKSAATSASPKVVQHLGEFWREEGFHGSTENFYSDRNSYIPDVLQRRTGLPIALSVVYLAIARRIFLDVDGVGLPGHFIVRVAVPAKTGGHFILIDPFENARSIDLDECRRRVESVGYPFVPEDHLKAVTPREILTRMCNNLLALFDQQKKIVDAERVVTVLSHLQPRDPIPLLLRAERRLRRGDRKGARIDFERAHALDPNGPIGRTAQEEMIRMGYENPFA